MIIKSMKILKDALEVPIEIQDKLKLIEEYEFQHLGSLFEKYSNWLQNIYMTPSHLYESKLSLLKKTLTSDDSIENILLNSKAEFSEFVEEMSILTSEYRLIKKYVNLKKKYLLVLNEEKFNKAIKEFTKK